MLLNASFDYPNVYSTLCDDYTTMFEATESMLDSGIADPVYIYNSISYSGRKKLNGFKDALKKHGISDIENRIHKYDGDSQQFNEIADFMDQVAKEAPPFHGVIAADDVLAVGVVKYAPMQSYFCARRFIDYWVQQLHADNLLYSGTHFRGQPLRNTDSSVSTDLSRCSFR